MITEKEYIKFLTDNRVRGANGENDETLQDSFFRIIIPNVGLSRGAGSHSDEKLKGIEEENSALKEIND